MTQSNEDNRLFRQANTIAIWIGDITSEEEMDDYLYLDFQSHFGLTVGERNLPESTTDLEGMLLRDLLNGFSESDLFLDIVCSTIKGAGELRASAAVVFYGSFYDGDDFMVPESAKLSFLGNFSWDKLMCVPGK